MIAHPELLAASLHIAGARAGADDNLQDVARDAATLYRETLARAAESVIDAGKA